MIYNVEYDESIVSNMRKKFESYMKWREFIRDSSI